MAKSEVEIGMTELTDRLAISDVMATYAACVDDRDDAGYRALFTEDVEVVGMGPSTFKGIDAWYDYWLAAVDRYEVTQHMLGPTLAKIDGDKAWTRTDVQALHYPVGDPGTRITLWATYRSDMIRTADGWKICRHELVTRGLATRTDP